MRTEGQVFVSHGNLRARKCRMVGSAIGTALLVAQFASATPILDVGHIDVHLTRSESVPTTISVKKTMSALLASTEDVERVAFAGNSVHVADANSCQDSVLCYQADQVPEPRSVILVGSGLLSMAGVFRRRLLQRP